MHINQHQITQLLDKDLYSPVVQYHLPKQVWLLRFETGVDGDEVYWIEKQRGDLRLFKTADAALRTAAACGFLQARVEISDLQFD